MSLSNVEEFTVSELSTLLKRTLEDRFPYLRLRGEVSGYKGPLASGHVYFALKDAGAKIEAIIWKNTFTRLGLKPEEGLEVRVMGRITAFPGKSTYQIIVEHLEPAGIGALMALLHARREKLQREGLFDPERKQLVPYFPQCIGVITSPTGAVIRDIIHRISARFPTHILIWPVRVQGETCAAEVIRAIEGFHQFRNLSYPVPDVLIIARGGGAIEDLWEFNHEAMVRAVSASLLPIISAIGHETDWTLIDYAADLRAPTPTGAAELCVPVRQELLQKIQDMNIRLQGTILRSLKQKNSFFLQLLPRWPKSLQLLEEFYPGLDFLVLRLKGARQQILPLKQQKLHYFSGRLTYHSPRAYLDRTRERLISFTSQKQNAFRSQNRQKQETLHYLIQRLQRSFQAGLTLHRQRYTYHRQHITTLSYRLHQTYHLYLQTQRKHFTLTSALLLSFDYRQVLARGFALVRDEQGHMIRSKNAMIHPTSFMLEFSDGSVKINIHK